MSGLGAAPSLAATTSRSGDAIIRRLLGDAHVMHMTLAHARGSDAHEARTCSHLLDAGAARVAHRRAQAAGELIENGNEAALVGHAAFDALGHQLLESVGVVLEVAIRRSMTIGHGAEGAHAAIGFI